MADSERCFCNNSTLPHYHTDKGVEDAPYHYPDDLPPGTPPAEGGDEASGDTADTGSTPPHRGRGSRFR